MSLVSRFAPSTTGPAHPGTLLAALLAWLDARASRGKFILRLEDLDPHRSNQELVAQMQKDLKWLGLDWDSVQLQSSRQEHYYRAMDILENAGLLYPCNCSRKTIKSFGERSPDGGWRYPNTCRNKSLPPGGWRNTSGAIRIRLDDALIEIQDESGILVKQNPGLEMGDPVARRRDGAFGYNLCSVVDDGLASVTRVVRGRDLLHSSPTHWSIQKLLGYPHPTYRHHFLFMENQQEKLAKFHGSVGASELRKHYTPEQLVGLIAFGAGLLDHDRPTPAHNLIGTFSWDQIAERNRIIEWTGEKLIYTANPNP